MPLLEEIFQELGISQYLGAFVDQGFDSWDTILDITESDLDALGVKLGHRRKLQRRIANHRGLAPAASLVSPTRTSIEEPPAAVNKLQQSEIKDGAATAKRKYRRHPKTDENAPERPPSAYVLFSNTYVLYLEMREDLKGQNLTFTEIAKLVGENWQSLVRTEKEPYETQAQVLKEKYNRDMTEYKKTADYKRYADYLHDFRKRQALHDAHKRARVDGDSSNRRSGSGMSLSASNTHNHAGSGSESHLGSEPPPTRQQRLGSITSQSDTHVSPIVSSSAFPRHADDTLLSPTAVTHEGKVSPRPRGFSSPASRDASDNTAVRYAAVREGFQPDASASNYFPQLPQLGDPRILSGPVSHSPEGGIPSMVPGPSEGTKSHRTSVSSQFWSRPPSLRAEQSSTGSIASLSSFSQPRTPSESSLPIHALLSSKPETPSMFTGAAPLSDGPSSNKPATPTQQYPGRPGDYFADSRLPYSGVYHSAMANQVQPTTQHPAPPILPKITGGADPGLDGMSALLRASDIVGRPEQ
ncbi:hypothetical protein TruAng_006466 [Truncatella angustata]|nr:hypothetical protein TruAng_006466 [Truncatella angustata]